MIELIEKTKRNYNIMFKVKNKLTNEIIQVLDAYCDEYGKTWFLIWATNKWAWRAADDYVPPNYQPKYKWIVAGSRGFQNYKLLEEEFLSFFSSCSKIFSFLLVVFPPNNLDLNSDILFPRFSQDFHASNKLFLIMSSSMIK